MPTVSTLYCMTKLYNANCINTDVLEKRQITLSDFYFFQEKEWLILDHLQNISSSLFSKNFFMKTVVNSNTRKHIVLLSEVKGFSILGMFLNQRSACVHLLSNIRCVCHTQTGHLE